VFFYIHIIAEINMTQLRLVLAALVAALALTACGGKDEKATTTTTTTTPAATTPAATTPAATTPAATTTTTTEPAKPQ
jgi:ABC-type glycerol-3-phosphate transport system substrate-binding protein